MRYAIATGRAERDPAADLRGALMPHVKKHRPALTTPEKVGRLMHAIYNYQGSLVVRSALLIMALTFAGQPKPVAPSGGSLILRTTSGASRRNA